MTKLDPTPIVKILRAELPDLVAIYLYGSHAQGRAREDSDIDLGALAGHPIDESKLAAALSQLQEDFGLVDLVDLRQVPLTLATQVLESHHVLFCSSEFDKAMWETTTMSRYANLNEERRAILEDIKRRGKIYG